MADDKRSEALSIVARRVIHLTIGSEDSPGPDEEDYPHLTDDDWVNIWSEAYHITKTMNPSEELFVAAHEFLTGETP